MRKAREFFEDVLGFVAVLMLAIVGGRGKPGPEQPEEPHHAEKTTAAPPVAPRRYSTITRVVLLIVIALVGVLLVALVTIGGFTPGPRQPVPFSHYVHASTKQISCFFCHPYAGTSANAGIPPVEKCMLCHKVIASNFKPIKLLRDYYNRKEPVLWARVDAIPDFVHFSHACHIARGVDCSKCHGNVKGMDRITPVRQFDMNFCVTCHWQTKASADCFICHY